MTHKGEMRWSSALGRFIGVGERYKYRMNAIECDGDDRWKEYSEMR